LLTLAYSGRKNIHSQQPSWSINLHCLLHYDKIERPCITAWKIEQKLVFLIQSIPVGFSIYIWNRRTTIETRYSHKNIRASPELLLPLSHNHLLFKLTLFPFPMDGLGVEGPSNKFPFGEPGPRGLGDPKEERLAEPNPPPIALLNNGLEFGENEEPLEVP
jgi:hypothetical protein